LVREQYWLDWLFALPPSLRYNFCSTAGSTLGRSHSEETKAKMSAALKGEKNPAYGRKGELHPMYGKKAANRVEVFVYKDNVLVNTFPSRTEAANTQKPVELNLHNINYKNLYK